MTYIAVLLAFVLGVISGIVFLFLYAFLRGRKHGWDDSNMTNAIRLWCHVIAHPGDFLRMKYEDGTKPFWYLSEDEFSEVVKTRPKEK